MESMRIGSMEPQVPTPLIEKGTIKSAIQRLVQQKEGRFCLHGVYGAVVRGAQLDFRLTMSALRYSQGVDLTFSNRLAGCQSMASLVTACGETVVRPLFARFCMGWNGGSFPILLCSLDGQSVGASKQCLVLFSSEYVTLYEAMKRYPEGTVLDLPFQCGELRVRPQYGFFFKETAAGRGFPITRRMTDQGFVYPIGRREAIVSPELIQLTAGASPALEALSRILDARRPMWVRGTPVLTPVPMCDIGLNGRHTLFVPRSVDEALNAFLADHARPDPGIQMVCQRVAEREAVASLLGASA